LIPRIHRQAGLAERNKKRRKKPQCAFAVEYLSPKDSNREWTRIQFALTTDDPSAFFVFSFLSANQPVGAG
jgi:hypothetical protein